MLLQRFFTFLLLGIRVLAQVLTTKIKDENKGTKTDNRQWI